MERLLAVCAVGLLAHGAAAAPQPSCREGALGRVVSAEKGLRVETAARAGLRAGDVLRQFNGRVLRTCDDLSQAVGAARASGVTVLLLIVRDGAAQPLVIDLHKTLRVSLPTAVPVVPATPIALELSASEGKRVALVAGELETFGRRLLEGGGIPVSLSVAKRLRGLRARFLARIQGSVGVRVLDPVLDAYETAADIVAYQVERRRHGGASTRRVADRVEFQSHSRVAEWLRRYPFLAQSVDKQPAKVSLIPFAEWSGWWSPTQAARLMIAYATEEAARLRQRVD